MRAIIRFSVDSDPGSALRNQLAGHLDSKGFIRSNNTATWEHLHISAKGLRRALSEFWKRASKHKGSGQIDHFWMYADQKDSDDPFPQDDG